MKDLTPLSENPFQNNSLAARIDNSLVGRRLGPAACPTGLTLAAGAGSFAEEAMCLRHDESNADDVRTA